jgi:hypothetical protein
VQGNLTLNGRYTFNASTGLFATTNNGLTSNSSSGNLFLGYYAVGDLSYQGTTITLGRLSNVNLTASTGLQEMVRVTGNFAPTSGTALFTALQLSNTINQTGGANGITRGLYINPTITAAADFRAIETTAGNVLLNTTSGKTLIGTTTDSGFMLDVNGTGIFRGALTVQSSTGGDVVVATLIGVNAASSPFLELRNVGVINARVGGLNGGGLLLQTGTTERARIANTGNVLINTTTDAGFKLT